MKKQKGFEGFLFCAKKSFEEIDVIVLISLTSHSFHRTISLRWRCKLSEKAKSVIFAFSFIREWFRAISFASQSKYARGNKRYCLNKLDLSFVSTDKKLRGRKFCEKAKNVIFPFILKRFARKITSPFTLEGEVNFCQNPFQ